MLVAPKYSGLDLPVYEPETFVANSEDLLIKGVEDITEGYTTPKFVRAISITLLDPAYVPDTMARLLEDTRRELEVVAEKCGALVVGHEWGLYPIAGKAERYQHYTDTGPGWEETIELPEGHILVAEVDTVRPVDSGQSGATQGPEAQESRHAIQTGVEEYYLDGKGTYQLFDMRYDSTALDQTGPIFSQFVRGVPVGSCNDEAKTYLTDIDPRFALTR